jgi:hypothetical protein
MGDGVVCLSMVVITCHMPKHVAVAWLLPPVRGERSDGCWRRVPENSLLSVFWLLIQLCLHTRLHV